MTTELSSLFEILQAKNSYLLNVHKINIKEIKLLSNGCIDHLERFYYSREILLNAIEKLDTQISKNMNTKQIKINSQQKQKLLDLFLFKKQMVISILDQDLAIVSLCDKIKKHNKQNIAA